MAKDLNRSRTSLRMLMMWIDFDLLISDFYVIVVY